MHHSLEVRVPFLDHNLVEYCATIPPEMKLKCLKKKYLLKKAAAERLPRRVINHRKQGFVGPMAQWLQKDLRNITMEKLSKDNLKKHGLLDTTTVYKILDEHYERKENNDILIWSLLIFQTWFELYQNGI